jgi:hypothetical protein
MANLNCCGCRFNHECNVLRTIGPALSDPCGAVFAEGMRVGAMLSDDTHAIQHEVDKVLATTYAEIAYKRGLKDAKL